MFTSYAVKDPMQSKKNIKISDIDQELHNLWDALEASNKIRACLFNLVLYTDDGERTKHFEELVKQIINTLPCRIIFIKGDRQSGKNYLSTSVSALTSGHGDQMVACDQITIDAAGDHLERIPFVVTPHIVPDLPVYLIWGQDPSLSGTLLPALEKHASRVVFDSECSADLYTFSRTVIDHLRTVKTDVADINWAKVKGWRDVVTQVFHSPEKVHHLTSAKRIVITYNAQECDKCRHPEVQAIYLQGWLAGRLNWKYTSYEEVEGTIRLTYDNPTGELVIILRPEHLEKLPSGCVMKVEVESQGQHQFILSREKLSRSVKVYITSPAHCEIPYTLLLSSLGRGQLLIKEIFYEPASKHYLDMLRAISEIN